MNQKSRNTLASIAYRKFYHSIQEINTTEWDQLVGDQNIYLSSAYLTALERAMKHEIDFFYSVSFNAQDKPVLITSFQLVKFEDKRRKYADYLCKLSYHIHKKISEAFTINVLVCGNVFCDGENGILWSEELNPEAAMDEVDRVVEQLKEDKQIREKSSVTLLKDFWPSSTPFSDRLKQHHYRDFMIDVNMVLKIHESWNTMDDYLLSMKTKFRTRAKGVYKKSKDIVIRTLSAEDIRHHEDRINTLFGNVLEKSDFSFGTLTAEAFANFQESLSAFTFRGFFLEEKLIGFSTSFFNQGHLEANFVGLDYEYNKDFAVYQRILYDYVEQSLNLKADELQLGRTAELVKSQIGALPTNMKLYVKHRKSVPNLLLKPILHSISPSEFELRKPFKANFSN